MYLFKLKTYKKPFSSAKTKKDQLLFVEVRKINIKQSSFNK
jgi:hypothetical protein